MGNAFRRLRTEVQIAAGDELALEHKIETKIATNTEVADDHSELLKFKLPYPENDFDPYGAEYCGNDYNVPKPRSTMMEMYYRKILAEDDE